jgi:type II secretory ATPase GspE/PulE/Tfp pilus assembly ATPase PilB-like protein
MSAPKHSGRTVSMYAALREIDLFARNVLAVEREPEIEFPDVHQLAVNQAGGQTLAGAVQDGLHSDADVILVETVGEAEAAQVMLAGAAAGKLLLGGLVANDAAEAVERFMRLAGDAKSAGAVLLAATNQRLLRTLCTGCREAYRPNPDFLRKANLQSSQVDVLYREPKTRPVNKKGETVVCPLCRNEGYGGHTVFYEVLALDEQARGELAAGRSVAEVRTMLRKQGQEFLQEEGLRKVVAGVTSVTELLRVLKTTG